MKDLKLKTPSNDSEWAAYHRIRRTVLWEARGRFGSYDPTHPDEHRKDNFPKLLLLGSKPIGVIRIDLDYGSGSAGFRRVAIETTEQRKGFGKEMMQRAEEFALSHGCANLSANVSVDAVGFYEKLGYRLDSNHPHNDPKNPRMKKTISTNQPTEPTSDRAARDHSRLI